MKKVFSVILSLVMVVSVFLTVFNCETTHAASKISPSVTISVGTVNDAKPDEEICVPVSFANVPETGIIATDMTILYDPSQLEYISAEAGSIVTNPDKNFDINKESDGILKLLFIDEEMLIENIPTDGIFVNLNFKACNLASSSYIKVSNPTVADKNLSSIPVKTIEGTVNISVSTPVTTPTTPTVTTTPADFKEFKILAGTVNDAKPNEEISIPVSFVNVPDAGITATDMTILYEPSQLEYISAEAGNIVINSNTNFAINKQSDGVLKLLFLDETQKDEYISTDGVFVNLSFKVCNYAVGSTDIKIIKPVVADQNLINIPITTIEGSVTISDSTSSDFTVILGTIEAKENETITVPLNFENVPSKGIHASNITIKYDPNELKYLSYEPGSIVPNPSTSFVINKPEDGVLKQLFVEFSPEELNINSDGLVANLYFKVLGSSSESTSLIITDSTFADSDLKKINSKLIEGRVNISGTAPVEEDKFTVNVGSVNANVGDNISIPVMFTNIPEKGIAACDMTIKYDLSKLEYVSYDIGGIVKNPDINFGINNLEDGVIKTLFLDRTMENEYITSEGVFIAFNFKVIGPNSGPTLVEIIDSSFCDLDIKTIEPEIVPGKVTIYSQDGELTLVVGSTEGDQGDLVSVPLNISNIPANGIDTIDINISFDLNNLEYVAAESECYVPNMFISYLDDGKMKLSLYTTKTNPDQNIKEDMKIANLVFKVLGSGIETTPIQVGDALLGYDWRFVEEVSVNEGIVNINGSASYTVSGYVYSDIKTNILDSLINEVFKVELEGTDISSETDSNGYFEIKNVPEGIYAVTITKPNYLKRHVENILVNENRELSKEPIVLWCGDLEIKGVQDNAINFEDIMELCKVFNSASEDDNYIEKLDLNKDGAINMEDIMIVSKHFNATSSSY